MPMPKIVETTWKGIPLWMQHRRILKIWVILGSKRVTWGKKGSFWDEKGSFWGERKSFLSKISHFWIEKGYFSETDQFWSKRWQWCWWPLDGGDLKRSWPPILDAGVRSLCSANVDFYQSHLHLKPITYKSCIQDPSTISVQWILSIPSPWYKN